MDEKPPKRCFTLPGRLWRSILFSQFEIKKAVTTYFNPCIDEDNKHNRNKIGAKMKTLEAGRSTKMPKLEIDKTVYIDRARGRRLGVKSNQYAHTQKSSNSLIRFRCSNSYFLSETGITSHGRLLLAKWRPTAEKKTTKTTVFDTADRHEKFYGRSLLYASAQGRHEPGSVLSLFSSLSFDISIKNSVQRWSSDFQGLFCGKISKMAQGSDNLSTLSLSSTNFFVVVVFARFKIIGSFLECEAAPPKIKCQKLPVTASW